MKVWLAVVLCFTLSSCGYSIVSVQHSNADIFVNNRFQGSGTARIIRAGIPARFTLEARFGERIVGSTVVKRRFDLSTFIVGYFTYGIGFVCAWRLPKYIEIPVYPQYLESPSQDRPRSPWDDTSLGGWD